MSIDTIAKSPPLDNRAVGNFLAAKLRHARHIFLPPHERGRLHELLRHIHAAVYIGDARLAGYLSTLAARLVDERGER